MAEEAVRVFYSYSRKDQALREKLDHHLAPLKFGNLISTWHDLLLEPGSDWKQDIGNQLDTAHIILLLVSANFLASEYCYSIELKRALERDARKEACVIPVILEPCDWKHDGVPFSKLTALPNHEDAITEWENREAAFTIVAQNIRLKVQKLIQEKKDREEQEKRQILAQKEAEEKAERERQIQREQQQQAEEQARQRQAERLRQKEAEAATEWLRQQELKRQEQLKQEADDLSSERGVDYTRLRDLLKAGQWQEADQETDKAMLKAAGREEQGYLRIEDIEQFPCADLRTIDRLWVKYSDGKFGFSVQKKIWQECGSPMEYSSNFEKFGDRVGWRNSSEVWINYGDVTFNTTAPRGHLPVVGWVFVCGWLGLVLGGVCLFSRVETCKV